MLAIVGSGETSPTMVTIHRRLADRIPKPRRCVLLEAPYLFQTNSSGVSAKAQAYFARSVGLDVTVVAGTGTDADVAAIRGADWVFAGPGSPSYALGHWRDSPIGHAFRDRIRSATGVTVFASAAAATIGRAAVPVYEIYKAGAAPHWLDGLDLLDDLGLRVAVVPHFDNTEGGTYDTRFCYLGEPRLLTMEKALPDGVSVLGVDEHTALLIDLNAMTCEVTGRGAVTVRRGDTVSVVPAGSELPVAELHSGQQIARSPRHPDNNVRPATTVRTLRDAVTAAETAFAAATTSEGRATAVLALEAAIHDWATDTDEDDGVEQARAVLRSLIVRLAGVQPVPDRLVGRLLEVRGELRTAGTFDAADAIRDALTAEGVEIHDRKKG